MLATISSSIAPARGDKTRLHAAHERSGQRRGRRVRVLALNLNPTPIKHAVILVALTEEDALQQVAQIFVIRAILKAQAPRVVEVSDKLCGGMLAKDLQWGGYLLLCDLLILILLASSF